MQNSITLTLKVKNPSIIYHSVLIVHNFNIFAGIFTVHDSNARAIPRVFVDVSPINQEDNDGITYFLFPIDFRWTTCPPVRTSIPCQDVRSFLISLSRTRNALNRCAESVINRTSIVQSRERLDLAYSSGPRRHLIWKQRTVYSIIRETEKYIALFCYRFLPM